MRTIRWFGATALLLAAGIVVILSQAANAESVILRSVGAVGVLSAAARGQLTAMVALCGSGQPASMDRVCVKRNEGVDASLFVMATESQKILTVDEAKAELRAGRMVPRGRIMPGRTINCTLDGPRLTAARNLVQGFSRSGGWDGNPDALLEFCASRSGSIWTATSAIGLQARDIDAVVSDAMTQDIVPMGIVP